jgi:hypothetical protein
MSTSHNNKDSREYLRSALVYFLIWLGVVILGRSVFSDGSVFESIADFKNGNWLPLLVVCASIVFIALALKQVYGYFRVKNGNSKYDLTS